MLYLVNMATLQRQDTLTNNPLFRKTPWPGITAVVGMALCLVASAVVIAVSQDDPVASWKVQPAVLIAIFSGTSNTVFNSALATGIAVRFWLSASRGVKLSQLHYIWDHGRVFGIGSAMRAGPPARTVAIFALLANAMQFVGAPLLQRATYQTLQHQHIPNESVSLDVAQTIPDGWFGTKDTTTNNIINFDRAQILVQQWWTNTSLHTPRPCDGTCHGLVPGAGFTFQCWRASRTVELATNRTNGTPVFFLNTRHTQNATGAPPYLRLTVRYLSETDDACIGTLREDICDLESATIEYPITIQNHTVTMHRDDLARNGARAVSRPVVPPALNTSSSPAVTPVEALWGVVQFRITDNATKTYDYKSNRSTYLGPGILSDIFWIADGGDEVGPRARCRLQFRSPTEYFLATLYDYMFRAAMSLGDGTETQIFQVERTVPVLVFSTDGRYLAAGLVVMTCGLVFVMVLMWGWWQLERPVTLSPLETASAMGAPIFQEAERGATINEILAKVRNIEFRVGGLPRVEMVVSEVPGKG